MKKILLDRSIFHGPKFQLLRQSKLNILTRNHIVTIYGNPLLLEETFGLELINRKEESREQLQYILDITNGRWFRDRGELHRVELERRYLGNKYFFLNHGEQKYLIDRIREVVLKGKIDKEDMDEVIKRKERISSQRQNLKSALYKIREEASKRVKEIGKKRKDMERNFDKFYDMNIEKTGERIIRVQLDTEMDKDLLVDTWKQNKTQYLYFTLWIRGFLYISYYAMDEPNKKIDLNAISDIDQLIYLKNLDTIVSDDRGFMKDAFQQLYGKSKQFLSSEQFLSFVRNN